MDFVIPACLSASCRQSSEASAWLTRLPAVIRELKARWSMTLGAPFDSDEVSCAWVAPVTRVGGSPAVLKVSMPHFEAEHEIAGLRFWDGDPTVRLIEADERVGAMLLERCEPGTHLRVVRPEIEQVVVVASLLGRLWRRPASPHPFRPLSDDDGSLDGGDPRSIESVARCWPHSRWLGPAAAVIASCGGRRALGNRPSRRQRLAGPTRALACHRPEALHRRRCVRRNPAPSELHRQVARRATEYDSPLRGVAGSGFRARSDVDVRAAGGSTSRGLAWERADAACVHAGAVAVKSQQLYAFRSSGFDFTNRGRTTKLISRRSGAET
jgi:Aminoglycoside/hydroxyurea antibiotic resistance kinase